MTQPLITRTWRLARVATASLALTAAALTVSDAAADPGARATAPVAASVQTAAPCLSKPSAERVRADSTLDGVDPNDLTLAQTRQAQAKLTARARQRGLSTERASLPSTKVDVYVHVIVNDAGKGAVSDKRIAQQIAVLNQAYAGKTTSNSTKTAFSFALKAVDRTRSSAWYRWAPPVNGPTSDDTQAKAKLHRGGPDDLNLYIARLDDGLLGYSSFPFDTTLVGDGVVVLNASLPGGSLTGYNLGDSATHEVGHWLGLLHTFENGCAEPGDEVDDTPAQADGKNVFSCDAKLDTCAAAGRDQVHNFMSYGDDKCLNRFTKGQVARMATMWQAYRAPGAHLS